MRLNIRAVKEAARIEDVIRDYGDARMVGAGRLVVRCVAPGHEDRTPSMSVYTQEQRFKCYGCGTHGDVLDLVVLAEGCELWEAMMALSERHGIELPGRPESWFRKQERQRPVREELNALRVEILTRRLYRILEPMVLSVEEDDELREDIARDVWAALWRRAEHMLAERRERDGQ